MKVTPKPYPVRDPKRLPKVNGRCYNPPGQMQLGGKGEEKKLPFGASRFKVTDR